MHLSPIRLTFKLRFIAITVILFLVVAMTQLLLTSFYARKVILKKTQEYLYEIICQIGIQINASTQQCDQYMMQIVDNPSIVYSLNDIVKGNRSKDVLIPRIKSEVLRLKPKRYEVIRDIYVFPIVGNPINCYYDEAMDEIDPYSQLILNRLQRIPNRAIIWDDAYREEDYISSYTPIMANEQVIGLVRMRFEKEIFGRVINNLNLPESNVILVIDEQENIVYSSDDNLSATNYRQLNKADTFVVSKTLQNYGWSIAGLIPVSEMTQQINQMNGFFLSFTLL